VPIIPILLFILIWEALSSSGIFNAVLFPPPSKVFLALLGLALSGELFLHLSASLSRVYLGLLVGSVLGIAVGLLTGRIRIIDKSMSPLLHVFRSFPAVAIIPLVIVWFGIGETAKLFSISFAVFFPVWMNTHIGASSIPVRYVQMLSIFKTPSFKKWSKVILPASSEFIIAGVRTGIAIAFIMVFVSELAGASSGVGYIISISQLSYRMDVMIAGLFVLGLLGAVTDFAFIRLIKAIFPWFGKK